MRHFLICCLLLGLPELGAAQEKVGKRPYELDWAQRSTDDHPPLVDFESLSGWKVEVKDSMASFECTREQQIWGDHVGKLSYRADKPGVSPEVRILSPEPILITQPFDAVTLWIYGNTWSYTPDPTTPMVGVSVLFEDAVGKEFEVVLTTVIWEEWHMCHKRLTPDQIKAVAGGAKFKGLRVTNGTNMEDRYLYFDNLAIFLEQFPPLTFKPRPERGIPMFPGQGVGTNTGPGKLPFPTRPETILPENLTKDFKTSVHQDGEAFVFAYEGKDGKLSYRLEPKTGRFSDITLRFEGRGGEVRPCVGGGVLLAGAKEALIPDKAEHLGTQVRDGAVISSWRFSAGMETAQVTHSYRLWGKSLVLDTFSAGGNVAEIRFGRAAGLDSPRLVGLPYYTYDQPLARPAVVVSGPENRPLFLAGHIDWNLSNASTLWAENAIADGVAAYNGGVRYIPKTDGTRNDGFDRFFLVASPRFEEVLPVIPNPVSPWKQITGSRVWVAHGAGNRESDVAYWTRMHRYGLRELIVTDHETGWRDGGESFTFRTRTAPGKGGDEGQFSYARVMQDKLGFVYGPYTSFVNIAPVNEFWSADLINRTQDHELQRGWNRCYIPKPARAVEYCELLAPLIQKKFRFSASYCDVHTAVPPWDLVDYDARVPGAGTFAAVFYAYGEIMLHEKKAWNGPVYSEGRNHFEYCGLTDGNYGQDQYYQFPKNPWLVDFDLRRMHDLCCNFGMGSPGQFYGQDFGLGEMPAEMDAVDRFLAATVAFGHPGFLVGGQARALRSYYMLQQLQCRYTQARALEILYAAADGKLLDSSAAVAGGAYQRSQVATRYDGGCMTVVNGNPVERMRVHAFGRQLDLPPNGYAGWTGDGALEVFSGDVEGRRCDYAATPAYIYIDGRGRFTRFSKAACSGASVCRILPGNRFEVFPLGHGDCGFATRAISAVALDEESKEIGPAEIRDARGLTYVMPVKGALSYMIQGGSPAEGIALRCGRDTVVAGEEVIVQGRESHTAAIPGDAKPGERLWLQFEASWIDFTVTALTDLDLRLTENTRLAATLTSNLPQEADAEVRVAGVARTLRLVPRTPAPVVLELKPPAQECLETLTFIATSGGFEQREELVMATVKDYAVLAGLPGDWRPGIRYRGQGEQANLGDSGAMINAQESLTSGGVAKKGIFMHPPWKGGVGYAFVGYAPLTLPVGPEAVFRALVGKGDGSNPGDGLLYKVLVVDEQGRESLAGEKAVTAHAWSPIEADLSAWAGKTIRLKLAADVGKNDNPEGDWGCWAEMRITSKDKVLRRTLQHGEEAMKTEAGPMPIKGLTPELLRGAKRGWLHYDGMGLSGGSGPYGSSGELNGVDLGPMTGANGDEGREIWAENVSLPLTPAAIAKLDISNQFVLKNTGKDFFKVRRFWLELELADGRKCSSDISASARTQPPEWLHAEGTGVPFGKDITIAIWFRP